MFSCSCVCLQHIIEFTVLHTSDLQTIKRLEAAYILAGFTLQIIPIRIISKQRSHLSEMFKKHRTYCYLRLEEKWKNGSPINYYYVQLNDSISSMGAARRIPRVFPGDLATAEVQKQCILSPPRPKIGDKS